MKGRLIDFLQSDKSDSPFLNIMIGRSVGSVTLQSILTERAAPGLYMRPVSGPTGSWSCSLDS